MTTAQEHGVGPDAQQSKKRHTERDQVTSDEIQMSVRLVCLRTIRLVCLFDDFPAKLCLLRSKVPDFDIFNLNVSLVGLFYYQVIGCGTQLITHSNDFRLGHNLFDDCPKFFPDIPSGRPVLRHRVRPKSNGTHPSYANSYYGLQYSCIGWCVVVNAQDVCSPHVTDDGTDFGLLFVIQCNTMTRRGNNALHAPGHIVAFVNVSMATFTYSI
jgi:hypothetical protein